MHQHERIYEPRPRCRKWLNLNLMFLNRNTSTCIHTSSCNMISTMILRRFLNDSSYRLYYFIAYVIFMVIVYVRRIEVPNLRSDQYQIMCAALENDLKKTKKKKRLKLSTLTQNQYYYIHDERTRDACVCHNLWFGLCHFK